MTDIAKLIRYRAGQLGLDSAKSFFTFYGYILLIKACLAN